MKKEKKKEELQETIEEIRQRFGEGAIMKLKEVRPVDVDVISSGSLDLNWALGVRGVPRGRVIEIFGAEGSGKCVKSDTIVLSELGMLPISVFGNVEIPEFQKKEVFLYSENSYEKTSHFYNGGVKPTIRIKTSYGYELEGTSNHRIRVLDKDGNYLFRRLDELKDTDYVAIQRGQNSFGNGVNLSDFDEKYEKSKSKFNTSTKDFKKFKITKEMAKLMGYMISEGKCGDKRQDKNNIQISTSNKEIENDFKRICLKLFDEEPKVTPDKRNDTKRLCIHNVKARAFLNYAGVGFWKSGEKEIPWGILCSPKESVASFLSTLFEGDGSVAKDGSTIEYASKSKKLIRRLQIVLLNFGIISKIKPRWNETYQRYYYHLYIDGQRDKKIFAKEIGFISQEKQKRLENYIEQIKEFATNRDIIPNQNVRLAKFLEVYREKIRGTNRKDWKLFRDYLPAAPGYSQLTYDRLKRILDRFLDGQSLIQYQEMEHLYNLGFFWDKIVEKKNSIAQVLDFTVPSNATFCGNGFVNHNTTLALHVCANAQKRGGVAAFIDAENAMDPDYAKKIGVNVEDLFISQPDSGEQALEIVESLVRSGGVDVIVVDSVAALTPKAEIAGEMGEFQIGLQARLMSQALRKLSGIIAKTKTIVVFLNQTRMKIGVRWGDPTTTPGGLALKFYSSVRIKLNRIAQIKQGDEIIGSRIRAKVVKNKVAAPFKTAEFDIYYNEGISQTGDVLKFALKEGLIERKGNYYKYKEKVLGQGMEGSRNFLRENPKVLEEIKKALTER